MRKFRLNDDNNKPGRKVTVSVIRRRDGVETPMEIEVKAGEVVEGEEFAKWVPSVLLEVNKESAILPISPEHPFVVPVANLRTGKQELIRSGTTSTNVAPPPPSFELRATMESKVVHKDSVPEKPIQAEVPAPKEAEPQPEQQDTSSASPRRSRVERRRVAGRT